MNEIQRRALYRGKYRAGRPSRGVEPDPIAVERLIEGTLNQSPHWHEMHEAITRLSRYGLSAFQIADRIGCTVRTVERHRAACRRGISTRGAA